MKIKLNIVHPRYYLEDDRPSQTTNNSQLTELKFSSIVVLKEYISSIPLVFKNKLLLILLYVFFNNNKKL